MINIITKNHGWGRKPPLVEMARLLRIGQSARHIFEQVSEQTDLDEYVYFAKPRRTFVDECIDLIEHPDSFPLSHFSHFKESPELNYVDIFLKLKQFHTTSKATWFTA